MSVLNAKRIADLNEELDKLSKELAAKRKTFRSRIDAEVVAGFIEYFKNNGFTISKPGNGAKADYKGLSVDLVLAGPEDVYIGKFHTFDIYVNGKKNDVVVQAKFVGEEPPTFSVNGDKIQVLELQVNQASKLLQNLEMESYQFDVAQSGKGRSAPVLKGSISEVLDHYLA